MRSFSLSCFGYVPSSSVPDRFRGVLSLPSSASYLPSSLSSSPVPSVWMFVSLFSQRSGGDVTGKTTCPHWLPAEPSSSVYSSARKGGR